MTPMPRISFATTNSFMWKAWHEDNRILCFIIKDLFQKDALPVFVLCDRCTDFQKVLVDPFLRPSAFQHKSAVPWMLSVIRLSGTHFVAAEQIKVTLLFEVCFLRFVHLKLWCAVEPGLQVARRLSLTEISLCQWQFCNCIQRLSMLLESKEITIMFCRTLAHPPLQPQDKYN